MEPGDPWWAATLKIGIGPAVALVLGLLSWKAGKEAREYARVARNDAERSKIEASQARQDAEFRQRAWFSAERFPKAEWLQGVALWHIQNIGETVAINVRVEFTRDPTNLLTPTSLGRDAEAVVKGGHFELVLGSRSEDELGTLMGKIGPMLISWTSSTGWPHWQIVELSASPTGPGLSVNPFREVVE